MNGPELAPRIAFALIATPGLLYFLTWDGRNQPNGTLLSVAGFLAWIGLAFVLVTSVKRLLARRKS